MLIVARESRSQEQNRRSAEERLLDLVRRALIVPKKRHATKPTRASRERRLDTKSRTQKNKRLRGRVRCRRLVSRLVDALTMWLEMRATSAGPAPFAAVVEDDAQRGGVGNQPEISLEHHAIESVLGAHQQRIVHAREHDVVRGRCPDRRAARRCRKSTSPGWTTQPEPRPQE